MTQHSSARSIRRLGGAAVVTGALAVSMVGLSSGDAHAATAVKYDCKATVFGTVIPQGEWTAEVTVDVPAKVEPGEAIPAPAVTAKVTTSTAAADTLRSLSVKSLSGTSAAKYTVDGTARTADLTVPTTSVPATGPVVTNASGTGAAETAPSEPGTIEVKVGDFTADLKTDSGLGLPIECALKPGQNTTIATIQVGDAGPTESPTSSQSPTDSPTTDEPTDSPTTDEPTDSPTTDEPTDNPTTDEPTGEPTGSETTPAPTGTVSGPPVQTDMVGDEGGANTAVALGGLATLGGVIGAGVVARRRMKG
ncbi:DUF6801 domain-containing protein [Luteipulveratus halotolerans]|uniref:DUF6801 domain-containing protein n=1 Tax=Luteipulveratus halotolerans TaxID=1631356 RepID=UPI000681DE94|nr:DUF6801 domain-containing protein [Luteipulveratus halotolerans]